MEVPRLLESQSENQTRHGSLTQWAVLVRCASYNKIMQRFCWDVAKKKLSMIEEGHSSGRSQNRIRASSELASGSCAKVERDTATNLSCQWCGRRVQWWRDVGQWENLVPVCARLCLLQKMRQRHRQRRWVLTRATTRRISESESPLHLGAPRNEDNEKDEQCSPQGGALRGAVRDIRVDRGLRRSGFCHSPAARHLQSWDDVLSSEAGQDGRNRARRTAVIHAVYKARGDLRQEFQDNSSKEKRRRPRSRSRWWSSTIFLELYWRSRFSESCCSKNETLCSEGRFSDTSQLHWCPETNKNEHWCASRSNHRWLLEYWWRHVTVRTLNQGDMIRIAEQKKPPEEIMWETGRKTGYSKTWTYLAGRVVKHVEKLSAQSHK